MNVLVTGASGQLGFDVVKLLRSQGFQVLGIDKDVCDITDPISVKKFFADFKPHVVVHCAAYTAVDRAEDERKMCYDVNVNGTKNLVICAKEVEAKFVYISTEYVFDGTKTEPYEIYDIPNPLSYYGYTKHLGEVAVMQSMNDYFIIRTSWVYGLNGPNFVKTMLRLFSEREEISVVNDQVGAPTYTVDLAKFISELIKTRKFGIYHVSNQGFCSWYEFACKIKQYSSSKTIINPIPSSSYPTRAKRPSNSRMSPDAIISAGFSKLPIWSDSLQIFLKELEKI